MSTLHTLHGRVSTQPDYRSSVVWDGKRNNKFIKIKTETTEGDSGVLIHPDYDRRRFSVRGK